MIAKESISFQLALQTAQGVVLSHHTAPTGSTVLQALQASHIDLSKLTVGVWSRSIKAEQLLQAGDRVECYMPLLADPKDARRARVNRSIAQQAAKENAANRAVNRAARLKRELIKQASQLSARPEPVEGLSR